MSLMHSQDAEEIAMLVSPQPNLFLAHAGRKPCMEYVASHRRLRSECWEQSC